MASPALTLKIAWGSAWNAVSPSYQTLPGKILYLRMTRGRNRIQDRFQAGDITIGFQDQSGELDEWNAGGAYFGDIAPAAKLQLTANVLTIDYYVFTGYVVSMQRTITRGGLDVVEIRAVDGRRRLNRTKKAATIAAGLSSDQIVALADLAGWPGTGNIDAGHRAIGTGVSDLQSFKLAATEPVLSGMEYVSDQEGGLFYIGRDGALTFIDRDTLLTAAVYRTPQLTIGSDDTNPDVPITGDIGTALDEDLIYNSVTIQRSGGLAQTSLDQDSIDAFGENSLDRSNTSHTTDTEALDQADYLLARLKDPTTRFGSIPIAPQTTNAAWPLVLGHDLGYRELVTVTTPNGSLISQEVNIEGIDLQMSQEGGVFWWLANLRLSLADPVDYWIVSTSAWDVDAVYAP